MTQKVPEGTCDHCLPDCDNTAYTTTVTSAPFAPCGEANLGVSKMCDLDLARGGRFINPPIWADQVREAFGEGNVPDYVQGRWFDNVRTYKNILGQEVSYDSFTRDIAIVNFYFSSPTAVQFSRIPRMNWVDFISQVTQASQHAYA